MIPGPHALLVAAAVLLSVGDGCGKSAGIAEIHDPTATAYRLASIDGKPLPAAFLISQQVTILSSQLCLFTDQTYRMVTTTRNQLGPGVTRVDPVTGPYSFSGSGTLGSAVAASINAMRDTVRLTYPEPAVGWVYVADPAISESICIRVGYY